MEPHKDGASVCSLCLGQPQAWGSHPGPLWDSSCPLFRGLQAQGPICPLGLLRVQGRGLPVRLCAPQGGRGAVWRPSHSAPSWRQRDAASGVSRVWFQSKYCSKPDLRHAGMCLGVVRVLVCLCVSLGDAAFEPSLGLSSSPKVEPLPRVWIFSPDTSVWCQHAYSLSASSIPCQLPARGGR